MALTWKDIKDHYDRRMAIKAYWLYKRALWALKLSRKMRNASDDKCRGVYFYGCFKGLMMAAEMIEREAFRENGFGS